MGWEWVGATTTAALGLAGIAGTVWVSRRDHHHQSNQALTDNRRRTYASLFAQGDRVVSAIRRIRRLRQRQSDESSLERAVTELHEVRQEFNTALYELALICSPGVLEVAEEFRKTLRDRARNAELGDGKDISAREVRHRLLNVMRGDLGYPPVPIELFGEGTLERPGSQDA